MSRHLLIGGLTLLASALPASSASATLSTPVQSPGDWLAWHGCWQPEAAEGGELLCVVPDGAGVRLLTMQGNEILAESRVIADGRARSVRRDNCSGTERAYWSADGRRVFLTSELNCSEGLTRKSSGMFAFSNTREWLSVQAVTVGDQTATRTVRYFAAEPVALPASISSALRTGTASRVAARQYAAADVQERDIQEAIEIIDPIAVREWLDETEQPFSLGGEFADGQDVMYVSALDQVGRMSNPVVRKAPKVVVIEQPTYVHRTYVTHVVRSCWDPFFSGFVLGVGHVVSVGVSHGYPCGRYYYSRYSPWGYDLYGWRYVHRPVLIVRDRPIIVRRGHDHYYYRGKTGHRYYDDDYRGGRVTRDGYRRDSGRVTRDGYTSDVSRPTQPRQDRDRSWSERDARVIQARDVNVARPRDTRGVAESRPAREVQPAEARPARSATPGPAVVRTSGSQRGGETARSSGQSSSGERAQARPARSR